LQYLHPEQVEVEIWRADALEVRRGRSSELDERWGYVDWKKIARQLAEKREVCRQYRSRRRSVRRTRMPREPFYGVVDPLRRTVYVNDPTNLMGVGALLDHLIAEDRLRGQGGEHG
jgi:hypothetical protein